MTPHQNTRLEPDRERIPRHVGRERYGRHALENADTNENELLKTLLILSSFAILAISGQAYAFDDFNKATMKMQKVNAAGSPPTK